MALGSTHPVTEIRTRSISWGLKRPVRKADNLPPSCAVVTKSGNLNFLETSEPLRACNGTALPLYLINDQIKKKNVIEYKMCVFIFSTDFVLNISHYKNNWARYDENTCWSSCKVTIFLVGF